MNGDTPASLGNNNVTNGNNNTTVVSNGTDYAADSKLRRIADDIREMVPLNAILPSEQITFPSVGEVSEVDRPKLISSV